MSLDEAIAELNSSSRFSPMDEIVDIHMVTP